MDLTDFASQIKKNIEETAFLVEASSCEHLHIWIQWHRCLKWEQQTLGSAPQIGWAYNSERKKMPVTVSLSWDRIEGHLVCFYNAPSMVVDHELVETWLKKTFKNSKGKVDAMNFHNCVQGLDIEKHPNICNNCQQMY
jgi:hypothetical protein